MIGEETPAAFVHPAEEATAIQQPDGAAIAEARPHHRSSPTSDSLPMEDEVPPRLLVSISHHHWLGTAFACKKPLGPQLLYVAVMRIVLLRRSH